jgi:hypothetical protein
MRTTFWSDDIVDERYELLIVVILFVLEGDLDLDLIDLLVSIEHLIRDRISRSVEIVDI